MRASGLVDISATQIGEAMEYALVTTAAGLAVAIPSVLAYNFIVSRVENFVLEIQTILMMSCGFTRPTLKEEYGY